MITAAVISITQTPNAQGAITVNTSTSQVTVVLYPAATAALPSRAIYGHALWSNPGNTITATNWISGSFIVNQVAQP